MFSDATFNEIDSEPCEFVPIVGDRDLLEISLFNKVQKGEKPFAFEVEA